jgi:hypothetical protein
MMLADPSAGLQLPPAGLRQRRHGADHLLRYCTADSSRTKTATGGARFLRGHPAPSDPPSSAARVRSTSGALSRGSGPLRPLYKPHLCVCNCHLAGGVLLHKQHPHLVDLARLDVGLHVHILRSLWLMAAGLDMRCRQFLGGYSFRRARRSDSRRPHYRSSGVIPPSSSALWRAQTSDTAA